MKVLIFLSSIIFWLMNSNANIKSLAISFIIGCVLPIFLLKKWDYSNSKKGIGCIFLSFVFSLITALSFYMTWLPSSQVAIVAKKCSEIFHFDALKNKSVFLFIISLILFPFSIIFSLYISEIILPKIKALYQLPSELKTREKDNKSTNKRNSCLNLLKCIACIGVVFIHITFPYPIGNVIKYMATFAVPLFFMIAGYYSFGCNEEKIKRRLIKIIKILIFGIFSYSIYHIMTYNFGYWIANLWSLKGLIYFICFCTIDGATPLWYLIAMAETYFVWMYVVKHKKENRITKYTVILFIIGAILTVVVDSMKLNWSYKINFICRAMPWFMLGYLVREKYENKLENISNSILMTIVILGWGVTLSAVFLKISVDYNYIGVLITAPSLFLIGIKNPNIKIAKPVEYVAEKISLFIYIFHTSVSGIIMIYANIIGINTIGVYAYIHPLLTLALTITISVLCEKLFRNPKLHKYIY